MRFLVCFVFFLPVSLFSQNLLVNLGFEEENICSEYKVNCAPEGWIYTVPSFIYYFEDQRLAYGGSKFVGLIAGHSNKPYYRTFVRSRLLCNLQKGNSYNLEFFIKSVHPVLDSIGVYFTNYDFLFEKQVYHKIIPSLYLVNASPKPAKKDTGWQKVSFIYKATGNEVFITLGNFSKRSLGGPTGVPMERNFFVLFDDISLTPIDKNERICADWKRTKEEIYAQDERHEYLDRYIKFYKNRPPAITKPSPTTTVHVDTLIIPDVFFATNSFMLNTRAVTLLDSFSKKINNLKLDSAFVYGHTDSRGAEDFNKELSWRRASSVAAFLETKTAFKFESIGLGSERPVASNLNASGRQRNRRVEILLYIKQ
jgi:outer membrane protein OmpA-like peptidoglycan-associated protein